MIPPFLIKPLSYLGIAVALLMTGYMKGCTDERDKRVQLEAKWEAAAESEKKRQTREAETREAITNAREAENATNLARLNADIDRLRRESRNRGLPPAPEGSKRPDLACFNRSELNSALREYRQEITELVGEGATCAVNLDTAKRWRQEQDGVK